MISAVAHVTLSKTLPPIGLGDIDGEDTYGTFNETIQKVEDFEKPEVKRSSAHEWSSDENIPV